MIRVLYRMICCFGSSQQFIWYFDAHEKGLYLYFMLTNYHESHVSLFSFLPSFYIYVELFLSPYKYITNRGHY